MSSRIERPGFCPMCMQNVEHARKPSPPFVLLDILTLGALLIFRVGPWYCFQCERKTHYLKPIRRSAPTFHKTRSRSEYGSPPLTELSGPTDEDSSESVGNYLRSEKSLVMQDKRANRFSQKFRDATVDRVLSGSATLAQIRNELEISEADFVNWIENLMARKNEQIQQLNQTLDRIQSNLPKHLSSAFENVREVQSDSADIVDGKTMPR